MRNVVRGYAISMLVLAPLFSSVTGCGAGQVDPETVAQAQQAYDAGVRAFESQDFPAAITQLTEAIETPGLLPDLIVQAYLTRARCRAETGDFPAALADLAAAEEGAGDLDQLHVVRGIVLRKQGDESAARAEFEKAKQVNPGVQLPR